MTTQGVLQEWTVLPHGELSQVDDGILTVVGEIRMPLTNFTRRMTVVRLRGNRLVAFSAIALDEDEMARLEEWGQPAFLVVPGDHHRRDAKVWKDRYPDIRVIAPEGARESIAQTVTVDATAVDFGDPDVQFVTVPGTAGHEAALVVRRRGGMTLVLNDLIANMRGDAGFSGWMQRIMGYAGDAPQIPLFARMKLIENKAALRDQLLLWATQDVARVLVSHGEPIKAHAPNELRRLAHMLE